METASLPRHYRLTMLFGVFSLALVSFAQGIDLYHHQNDIQKGVGQPLIFPETFERYRTECPQGEYLNLCAECVMGETEKEDDFGTDSCGVCGGLDTCLNQCTDPMAALDEELGEEKGCTKLISMTPNVLDRATSANGIIWIFGDGINPENVEAIECTLKKDGTTAVDFEEEILEDKVELKIPVPDEEGTYDLFCNSSVGDDFKRNVQVINTKNLLPMTLDKSTIVTWTENELRVTVSKMAGPVEVICFGRDDRGTVLYKEWTSTVEGNKLSSVVVCPRVTIVKPGEIHFGIAYSEKAIGEAKTLKVTAVALSPNPVGAEFIPEIAKVVVTFDQNLEDTILEGCSSMFKQASLLIFGDNPDCKAIANEIHVNIKDEKDLANTNLEFTDNVKTKFSEVAVEGSVRIDFGKMEGRHPLRLEGSQRICPGESTDVKVEGQQMGMPIWELNLLTKNLSNNKIPAGQQQRLNLILWAANRSSRAFPRALRINSSEVPAGMKYRVSATAKDFKGTDRQASMEVVIARPGETWLEVQGPELLDVRGAAVFEAVVRACGVSVTPDKFVWDVINTKGAKVDTTFRNGARLFLDGGLVQPNDVYRISVQAFQGEKLLGTGELHVKTTLREFQLRLAETNLVVGTGQPVEVDASKGLEINPKILKFKWSCKKGYCFVPGKDKVPLGKLETFSDPFLRLPSKSLAIGRYQLEVEAMTEYGKSKAELEVNVISGQPPYFSRLSASDLDPGRDLVIQVDVSEVHGLCEFYWESVPLVGVAYLPINKSKALVEGTPTTPGSSTLSLRIARTLLKTGGKYRLRILADCGRMSQSHYQFQLFLPSQFPELRLQVQPNKGTALTTEFVYNLLSEETGKDYLYQYGYEENGEEKYFHTGYRKEFKTILGEGSYRPIVKACRLKSDCMTVYGKEITNSLPTEISDETLRGMISTYQDLIINGDFAGAKAFLELTVPVLQKSNEKKYQNFSVEVQDILLSRIKLYKERLNMEKLGLEASVLLLDAATNALTLLSNNDEAMTALLKFRDLIHLTNQLISEKKIEKKLSANLPVEPRSNYEQINLRIKRETEPSHKQEGSTKQIVNAFLHLFSKMPNITNNSTKLIQEKIVILNYIAMYAAELCNETDNSALAEADAGFSMIGSAKLKQEQLAKVLSLPQCSKGHCPNSTAQVSVNSTISTAGSIKSFCLATAYLRDDILSDVSISAKNKRERLAPIFWMDLLPYTNGFVGTLANYSFLLPRNITNSSHPMNNTHTETAVISKGNINLQIPLRSGPKPKGTFLKCSRYENGAWNITSCTKNKELPLKTISKFQTATQFILCTCPYPGYYSVFAVPNNGSGILPRRTAAPVPSSESTKQPVLPTTPAMTPTISVPTTTTGNLTSSTPVTSDVKNNSLTVANTQLLVATTPQPVSSNVTSENVTNNIITSTVIVPTSSFGNISTNISVINQTSTAIVNKTVEVKNSSVSTNSFNLKPTAIPDPEDVTASVQLNQFRYLASFRINESFSQEVENHEREFLENLNKQLAALNLTLPSSVESEKGLIKVTLMIDDNKLKEEGRYITLLVDLLKNGSLVLHDTHGTVMPVPSQDLQLVETTKNISKATTAFITVMVVFLLLLIGALVSSVYLRNSRMQRCVRLTQGLQDDPPAPKYLRLHDSVSLGSSGPSSPNNDMESSLAVVTRPNKSRGYNTMDQFSNLPGNI